MNKNILLSVIIPVYNTEKYVIDCIESIDFDAPFLYEIIIINDGSTDRSEQKIKKYINSHKSPDKFRYFSQSNHGQGFARNYAITKAKGKYIYFMDSDDLIDSRLFIKLFEDLESKNLDAIFFDSEVFVENNVVLNESTNFNYNRVHSFGFYESGRELFIDLVKAGKYFVSPCMFILKREVLIKNKELKFLEGIIHEDDYFSSLLPYFLERVEHKNELIFKRRVRNNSTMTNTNWEKHIKGYSQVFINLIKFYEQNNDESEFFKYFLQITISKYMTILDLNDKINENFITPEVKNILVRYKYFNFQGWIASYCYPLYKLVLKAKNNTNALLRKR